MKNDRLAVVHAGIPSMINTGPPSRSLFIALVKCLSPFRKSGTHTITSGVIPNDATPSLINLELHLSDLLPTGDVYACNSSIIAVSSISPPYEYGHSFSCP